MSWHPDPSASVIMPAHNEQAVIADSIRALLEDAAAGEFDVVVVANACTDETAMRARGAGARVLETPIGGKAHALRLGDAAALAFPRLYLDADVVTDTTSARALVTALAEHGVLACAPVPKFDLAGIGPIVRRLHHVHDRLIAPQRALAGVGLYALNAEGHRRVFPLPDVLADDEWVHRSFAVDERRVVVGARTVIRPAPSLRAYLRRRARVRAGNDQLAALGRPRRGPALRTMSLVALTRAGSVGIIDAVCYSVVIAWERGLAAYRRRRGVVVSWGTDEESRSAAAGR